MGQQRRLRHSERAVRVGYIGGSRGESRAVYTILGSVRRGADRGSGATAVRLLEAERSQQLRCAVAVGYLDLCKRAGYSGGDRHRLRLLCPGIPSRQKAYPGQRSRRRCRRSEEHTSELQSRENLVCRLLLEKKKHARD